MCHNHRYTSTPEDTVAAGLKGGTDLNCGNYYQQNGQVPQDYHTVCTHNTYIYNNIMQFYYTKHKHTTYLCTCIHTHAEEVRNGHVLLLCHHFYSYRLYIVNLMAIFECDPSGSPNKKGMTMISDQNYNLELEIPHDFKVQHSNRMGICP